MEIDTIVAAAPALDAARPTGKPIAVPVRGPWRAAFRAALAVWTVLTVMHVAVSALAWLPRKDAAVPDVRMIFLAWNRWDAGLYVRIAEHGYHLGPGFPAFFPLYPLLVHLGDVLLPGDALVSALVVANVAAFGALAVLYRLADYEFGPRVAQRTIWYLAAFPTGFFLFLGYNESLFIMLAAGALYAGRRGHWWLAGGLGAMSSATRLFGVLLMVPLGVEYLRQIGWQPRRIRLDALGPALVPLGVVAYSVYCLVDLGSPFAFSAAQRQWGRQYTVPGQAWLIATQQMSGHKPLEPHTLGAILDTGTIVVAVTLLILTVAGPFRFRRDQVYLVVQAALTLVLLMSTETAGRAIQSSARYTLEALAVFLVLARMGANRVVDRAVLMIGAALHAVFLVIFMAGTLLVG